MLRACRSPKEGGVSCLTRRCAANVWESCSQGGCLGVFWPGQLLGVMQQSLTDGSQSSLVHWLGASQSKTGPSAWGRLAPLPELIPAPPRSGLCPARKPMGFWQCLLLNQTGSMNIVSFHPLTDRGIDGYLLRNIRNLH